MPTKIASFGNFALASRVKFPKLAILNGARTPKEIMQYGGVGGANVVAPRAHPVGETSLFQRASPKHVILARP